MICVSVLCLHIVYTIFICLYCVNSLTELTKTVIIVEQHNWIQPKQIYRVS